jgi:galactose oxidase
MKSYGITGSGSQKAAGLRASDNGSMTGDAILYDAVAGNILTVGGLPYYQQSYATSNARVATLGNPES